MQVRRKALIYEGFTSSWERTNLVVRTVFKIAEVVARRLVGSIPTRFRQEPLIFPEGFPFVDGGAVAEWLQKHLR